MKKFTIYIGNMVGITVEGESKNSTRYSNRQLQEVSY